MKKFYKVLAFFLFISIMVSAQPVKRVLFEQHTGTWCGWCVDGTHKLDQILEEHTGLVIPVKLHNGASDKMSLQVQLDIGNGLSITGYPGATIDRNQFGGTYFPDRIVSSDDYSLNAWIPLVEERLALPPKVDIFALYNLDDETGNLSVILTVNMLETVTGNLKFNVYILEDSVTGTGTGWDQANYLSNRVGWEFSPYFNLPNPVTNYYHRNVVRNLLGGAWGVTGEFTNPANEGVVFTQEFTTTLDPSWNKEKIQIVAFVANDDNKEILNACYGDTKPPAPAIMELTSETPDVGVLNDGDTFVKEFSVKNISGIEHQFQISMNVSAQMPDDWAAQLPVTELTIPAGETESFIVRLTSGATVGLGEVKVIIESITDLDAPKATGSLIGISGNIENFEVVNTKEAANSILPYINNNNFYFNIGSKEFSKLCNQLPNVNSVIWNLGDADDMAATDVTAFSGLVDKGTDILLLGYKLLPSLDASGYLDDLGLEYYGYSQEGYAGYDNDNYSFWLKGAENDPLTGSMFNKILYLVRKSKDVHVAKIIDFENVFPLLTFRNDQKIYTDATNSENCLWNEAICGVRINKGNSKIVLAGINPSGFDNTDYRDDFINNSLDWFSGIIDVDDNSISSDNFHVSVSPNPVDNFLMANFSINNDKPRFYSLSLLNTLGQEVSLILNETVYPGNHSIKHNITGLPNGTYFLVLKNDNGVQSIPVIIYR